MDSSLLTRLYADHIAEISRRTAKALKGAGFDGVVIHSGSLKKRSDFDDQYWPLRPVPHFQHWCPLAHADCAILFEPGKQAVLAWLKAFDFWERPSRPETEHFTSALRIAETHKFEEVKGLVPRGKIAFIGEDASRAAAWGIDSVNPPALLAALDAIRVLKTEYEVACLEEANRRAARGHEMVLSVFKDGDASELDLHLDYLRATRQDDAETPYKNIVALGANAATLHHVSYVKRARSSPAQSLLLDAGATYQGYCSDITRTWFKGIGPTASAFGALVDGVEKLQQRLCESVAIGLPYEELHDDAHRQVANVLRDVGISKLSATELVDTKITRTFFPHGLGHSLGLQCHDVGCAVIKPKDENPYLRNTAPIAAGQCFTIEPGIYFIDGLLAPLRNGANASAIDWKLVNELAALGGVRIEDDLVVVEGATAARNLTRPFLPSGGGRKWLP